MFRLYYFTKVLKKTMCKYKNYKYFNNTQSKVLNQLHSLIQVQDIYLINA